jgi:Polysaccharide lyase family 4, domain II/Copper binding proteins, plastocyanin/azurin family
MVPRLTQQRLRLVGIVLAATLAACSKPAPASSPESGSAGEAASTGPASASSNTGTTVIGRAPVTHTGAAAIVILEPRHSTPLPEPATMPYMDQLSRTFIPSVLFVRTGHRAQFLNSDEELHNINVKNGKTREQAFNVALPPGISYVHTFEHSGVYDVSCDAHSGMSAQIIAASSPYVALADSNGHFEIPQVVPGIYAVTVYAGAEAIETTVEVTGSRTEVNVTRQ